MLKTRQPSRNGIRQQLFLTTELLLRTLLIDRHELQILDFQIDGQLGVVDGVKAPICHENIVFQGKPCISHALVYRRKNSFVVDRSVIARRIDHISGFMVNDGHIVDLLQFRVLLCMSPGGIQDR